MKDERAGTVEEIKAYATAPLLHDPMFLVPTMLAALCVVVAVGVGEAWVAAFNIPCAFAAAGASLRTIRRGERRARVEARLTAIVDRENHVQRQFKEETTIVEQLMARASVVNSRDLLERLDLAIARVQQLQSLEAARDAELANPKTVQARQLLGDVRKKIEACEEIVVGADVTQSS